MKILIAAIFGIICIAFPSEADETLSNGSLDAIIEAIKNGNFETFQGLIKSENVNMADEKTGRTALHHAAEFANENFIDFLLKNGANVDITDKEGVSVLHVAALNNNEKVLNMLINNDKLINQTDKTGNNTPAHLAALNSNEKIMETLINHGANISSVNNANETPLHWAAVNTNEKVADLLIKKGANLEAMNEIKLTPLAVAALNSNPKIAELLLKSGANVKATDKDLWTPLFFAVANANDKFRELYVGTSESEGFTDGKVIEYLVKHWTQPMQERAGEKIAELLIDYGADVNQEDIKESTPCDEAGTASMKEVLKARGAKCGSN